MKRIRIDNMDYTEVINLALKIQGKYSRVRIETKRDNINSNTESGVITCETLDEVLRDLQFLNDNKCPIETKFYMQNELLYRAGKRVFVDCKNLINKYSNKNKDRKELTYEFGFGY